MALLVTLYKVVLTFTAVDEKLVCDHLINERYQFHEDCKRFEDILCT